MIATYGPPQLTEPQSWSPDFRDLLKKATIASTETRPNAGELLTHPFLAQACPREDIINLFQPPLPESDLMLEESLSPKTRQNSEIFQTMLIDTGISEDDVQRNTPLLQKIVKTHFRQSYFSPNGVQDAEFLRKRSSMFNASSSSLPSVGRVATPPIVPSSLSTGGNTVGTSKEGEEESYDDVFVNNPILENYNLGKFLKVLNK